MKEQILSALDEPLCTYIDPKNSVRGRRLTLRVDPKSQKIKLMIPTHAGFNDVMRFLDKNEQWVHTQIKSLPQSVPFEDGAIIPILGIDRKIRICPPQIGQSKRVTEIKLTETELLIYTARPDPSGNIKRWLKYFAQEKLSALSYDKAAQINKTIKQITLRDTTSRWGSCSIDGKISYSWRLIFCPEDVLDYITAHEVAHLKHMDHSPAFWTQCDALSHNMPRGREWLKLYGNDLMRYG